MTIDDGCKDPDDPCVYQIAVRAFTHTLYSITASSAGIITRLQQGVSLMGVLKEGETDYFSVEVSDIGLDGGNLIIGATALTGDPDIYVSMDVNR